MKVGAMTAFEIKKGIEEKKFTSEEVVTELFKRIKEVDKDVDGYLTLCEEEALKTARAVDEKLKKEKR